MGFRPERCRAHDGARHTTRRGQRNASQAHRGMTAWATLADELDAWGADGRRATLWWRDDDACSDSAELRRMLAVAERHRAPLTLAAIPADLEASLAEAV